MPELSELVRKADDAKQIMERLEDVGVLEYLRAVYVKAIRGCHQKDDLGRLRYTEALNQVDLVWEHLQSVVATGELARKHIEELNPQSLVDRVVRKF